MTEKFYIAAYCRISVDDELNKENTSIENQKAIIEDYVKTNFPNSELDFYEDRDKSGYTFEQREGYQKMRRKLFRNQYDILIIKDLSRFSRRNGAGLVELEALRDEGIRIIAIGDNIDYPTNDDWLRIQIYFLMNEMPVTDTSKKVRNVIKRRQQDGKWICSVPYGYVITNSKTMAFEIEPTEAVVVRKVYELYNQGWGYKRIANYLTDQHIPTPRMNERARKEARGEECHLKAKPQWSIATIQGILTNDFYIGTLRQGKYTRKKINGKDIKRDESDHIIFLKNHEPIIDYRVYATAQNAMQERTRNNYRGTRIYTNAYSGLMVCGDCGSPMFPMSRSDLKEAYRCGEYHKRGLKGCTSHHIRVDTLDAIVKAYLQMVRDTSSEMIENLQETIAEEEKQIQTTNNTLEQIEEMIDDAKAEKKALMRQCARDIARKPEREKDIQETYDELIMECDERIEGLENQIKMTYDKHNTVVSANRTAQLAIDLFDEILNKEKLEKNDLELLIEKITVYEDHIHIKLKDDIDHILHIGNADLEKEQNQQSKNTKDKKFAVNIVSDGEPLPIYSINWNLRYDRNNQTYRMLVSICYLVLKGLLQTQSDGTTKLMDFLDEQRMHRLYEKFILEYYRKEHPELTVGAPQIPWQLDDDFSDMLPVMKSDIVLEKDDNILIIDAKYYAHTTQQRFNKATVHSANLYQIFTYVKNKQEELKDRRVTVSGMLLYAKTDEQIVPDNSYQMSGNQIIVKTLDLNCGFLEIKKQLNNILKTVLYFR